MAVDVQKALELASRYGQIKGDHHRCWVIDQMVRTLTGSSDKYDAWITEYQGVAGDYHWDQGIPP